MVSAGRKSAHVRKVQILRDEKATDRLCRLPDMGVILTSQAFLWNGIGFMAKLGKDADKPERKILVQLDSH